MNTIVSPMKSSHMYERGLTIFNPCWLARHHHHIFNLFRILKRVFSSTNFVACGVDVTHTPKRMYLNFSIGSVSWLNFSERRHPVSYFELTSELIVMFTFLVKSEKWNSCVKSDEFLTQ